MNDLVDNSEIERVLLKLEGLEDEALAVDLLKKFNDATKEFGRLLLNKDSTLEHDDWKKQCDAAKAKVEETIAEIDKL